MSFLSAARFGRPDPDGPPNPVRIPRILMWVQLALVLLMVAASVQNLLTLRAMTDAELAESTDGDITSQADIQYTPAWAITIVLIALGLALGWCAWRLPTRARAVRTATITTEVLLIVVIMLAAPSLCNLGLFVLPAGAVIITLTRSPAREWFTGKPQD
ncbi:hypothetical protein LX16_1888 [Stackebrandtia albiflava]|uniref:Integral membrane protein n=1 Tax=Stackebrandtia albiflava TaxID=406432 RepID=A0A562VE91_9ACTN|nr:hypothetical protein [Stackebrandtia albiflava]TWJ16164.1 hypothetical protein LX16_1888 [Stackebrandtia albiflava]